MTIIDENHNPTEEYLAYCRCYTPLIDDIQVFVCRLTEAFQYGGRVEVHNGVLTIDAGAWPGHVAIVDTINESLFGKMFWESSHRGGIHKYKCDKLLSVEQLVLPAPKPYPAIKPVVKNDKHFLAILRSGHVTTILYDKKINSFCFDDDEVVAYTEVPKYYGTR
jgi:hypothetical protein